MRSKARIIIKGMGPSRGPGTTVAVVNDASNIGASTYFNAPGEAYFTLRIDHPQAGSIEPWRTHYAIQENDGGVWRQRYEGLIVDFDANENDVIFYGMDYLGLLDRVIDTRYDPDNAEAAPPDGSKHIKKSVTTLIKGMVDYARTKSYSPVEFITRGSFDTFKEEVTIFSTFTAIGSFIQGLVESHRQGTGRRSRFWVQRVDSNTFKWRLANNWGVNRPGIRLTYGGMVQGFNIIGFGSFGTKAHGIGRKQQGASLYYKSATAPGMSLSHYGRIEVVDFHDNIADQSDLQRRVKQHAASVGRVGKRIALGLKVEGLSPFKGYDIADNIKVDIQRGVIDTSRYGSGYWMVVGVEWRVFPDGHDELTLVVLPKEDGVAPDKDLLVAQEVIPDPAYIPEGSITSDKLSTVPPAVTSEAIADGAIDFPKIAIEGLPAEVLTSGILALGSDVPNEGVPDEQVIFDSTGSEIGRWNSTGLTITDPNNPMNVLRLTAGVLEFSSQGGIDGSWVKMLDSTGATADAITHGVYPGGSNRIPNAGFEMAAFAVTLDNKWPSEQVFTTTIGTDVDVTKGATLAQTTATY